MSTTLTPPPVPPAEPPAGPPRKPRPASRVIAILMIALGAVVVLGAIASAAFTAIAAASVRTDTRTVDAAGLDALDVNISGGSLRIVYAQVDEAALDVTSGSGADRWRLDREGDTLVLESPNSLFGGWWFGGNGRATLTLPAELERTELDATLALAAGDLEASGRFGQLAVEMGAGDLTVSGAARDVTADVSAGRAQLDLDGVSQAQIAVSAGQLMGRFTGSAPTDVGLTVSAGSLELALPDETYDVRADVSAGDLDNRLDTSNASPRVVEAEISAGQVILRSGR
ncbi:hypothetical protein M4I32_06530 [Microbacterium sp. LRZ72]|uniref:hypothetical protein n=1 Tax=Microbacterium sp. LRZ72 TaxID=2942481 RepID=UPI0029B71085|nr:hypothetical protein [Microbacterium sp. LRZ72]MDX2376453.1 hypothetical protein [Microbacterium sp. LRZ72]